MAIGLSLSNESVQSSYFIASHLLQQCDSFTRIHWEPSDIYPVGYCLLEPAEQQGSLRFLSLVEKGLGWRTSWIGKELERQWMERDLLHPETG